jgi:protein-disulfide isomerase
MARSKAVERREQRETEKRAQQRRWTIISIVSAIVMIAVLVFLVRQPADAPLDQASAARYADIEQSRTEDGFARLGDPAAPVNVTVYTSYASSNAGALHREAIDALVERVRAGSLQLIYVPMTLGNADGSQVANGVGTARAALCAVEQSRFWQLTDAFFNWQGSFGNQAFTNNRIVAGLDALQIDQNAYNACLSSARPGDALNAAETDAEGLQNFTGMPTVAINGAVPLSDENVIIADTTTLLARIDAAIAEAQRAPEATPEATEEAEAASEATAESTAESTPAATEEPTEVSTVEPTAEPTSAATATPSS